MTLRLNTRDRRIISKLMQSEGFDSPEAVVSSALKDLSERARLELAMKRRLQRALRDDDAGRTMPWSVEGAIRRLKANFKPQSRPPRNGRGG
jgi:Arc/MetJ-type ribon-helix-helix transcriptional regulator